MMRKITWILILLITIGGVIGLGISPARIFLEPTDTEFEFKAVGATNPIEVRVEGDLAEYISLEQTTVQPEQLIRGKLLLPPELAPGSHNQRIIISEMPDSTSGTVSAKTEIAGLLMIKVPYPDKYLEAEWSVAQDSGSTESIITVMLENRGTLPVTPDDVVFYVADEAVLHLATPLVEPAEFVKIKDRYGRGTLSPGVYTAALSVLYADTELTSEKEISLGFPSLTLESIEYQNEAGPIKPLDISGTVTWNRPLQGFVEVFVDNISVLRQNITVQESFSERLYLETPADNTVRVVVSVAGASAEISQDVTKIAKGKNWMLLALAVVVLVVVLWMLWRRKRGNTYKQT